MTAQSPGEEVLLERGGNGVVVVRLNRPEVRNALDMATRRRLAEIFAAFAADGDLRCVVLAGSGTAFAAGADLREMAEADAVEMYLRHTERLWAAIADCPVPVVAAVNGPALGGGLELAMHADIIVAGRDAKLGQPEVRVGIMPGAGGTQRLTRAVGKFQAMRLCLTGEIVDGEEAYRMGLVSKLVDDGEVEAAAMDIAATIAGMPPLAVAQIKEVVLHGQDASLGAAMALERKAFQLLFASRDKREGVQAFLDKRKPDFTGR